MVKFYFSLAEKEVLKRNVDHSDKEVAKVGGGGGRRRTKPPSTEKEVGCLRRNEGREVEYGNLSLFSTYRFGKRGPDGDRGEIVTGIYYTHLCVLSST